jgi:ankyrin repeat protein
MSLFSCACKPCVLRVQERKQQHDPPGTYEGQTALHIAIVNRDFDMVKFLVQVRGCLQQLIVISSPGGVHVEANANRNFHMVKGSGKFVAVRTCLRTMQGR